MAYNASKLDEKTIRMSRKELFKRLFSYLKPFKKTIILITFVMIIIMFVNLLNPYILKISIDNYIKNSDVKGLLIIGIIGIILNIISSILSRYRIVTMGDITNKIVVNIRHDLYKHIQKLSFDFFDERPVGKILARVIGDINSLQNFFHSIIVNFFPEILTIITVTIIMLIMNYKLAIVTLLVIPLLIMTLAVIQILVRKRWENFRKKRSNLNSYTHEEFSGIKVIQAFNAEKKAENTFFNYVDEMVNSFINAVRLQDFLDPAIFISQGVGLVIIYTYSFNLIKNNQLTIGELFAFTWYMSIFWRPIFNIANFYNNLITSFSAADRVFEIFNIKPSVKDTKENKMPEIKGEIEFKDVNFSYDREKKVLKSINFKVKEGESIALVGPTGAGKTTIINLLSRFYDPSEGQILVDGKNIKDYSIESYREQMGIMLQDTFLFSTTIKENIIYSNPNINEKEIVKSSIAIGSHTFIQNLEKKYDTNVNERGTRLSVGQRQLISLTRAMIANPKILILDEATSNIDTETEQKVQQGIKELLKNRTSFIIAHRLSTIRDCDKIFYIDNGEIEEMGTHMQLMEKQGKYYELYMTQFKFLKEGV